MAEEKKQKYVRGVVVEFDFTAVDGAQLLFDAAKKRLADAGVDLDIKLEAKHLVGGNYQWYWQDNGGRSGDYTYSRESRGVTVMGGIATRATERIEYRVLGGWSRFKFADGAGTINGWTYQFSGKWQISDTLNAMVLGSSYYQPSEYQYATAIKVHTISGGLGKSFVRGKVTSTLDMAFRREAHEYSQSSANDYDRDIWTARVGLNYVLNRFVTLFGRVEYQFSDTHGEKVGGHYYDYDRWRATVGMRLTY